ncbi:nicotinate-nucleotide--dimethylbenzimidazole phosphoribosyltransferase [Chelativorans sp. AA-79]|uniref:nicotinate-nucleotide--dimethylbenzimidazole phosphoribosyltransferase n=1 Tax=Chelativorans sp. AA-79 TaxID=3028735 RepID=UPI0023F9ED05|nr:nicotinate-nucleotide--dimethylbenzimidazole phosphoribosyltransferase [Chelativorans sp. AA-79]WEX07247.1 nicotinate-nucleotide--dimethylbenzimidazole phosphoribosyltransferase [Chelativorans sp. AA-79]
MTSGLPFDDIRNLIAGLPALDEAAAARAREALPAGGGSLGRLAEIIEWLAAVAGHAPARVARPTIALFAASHAVSRRLGTADPVGEAQAHVEAIAAGAAPVSHLCASSNLGLNVFDLALEMPVEDFSTGPALDERAAAATMAFGMEAVATGADLICLGTVDRAGDLSAMALISALSDQTGAEWAEAGQGSRAITQQAMELHRGHLGDPLEAMRRLAGREIAALAGAILAARTQKVAVILDGLAATAAGAALHALNQEALDHCLLASAVSDAHREAAAAIGLRPLLNLDGATDGGMAAALAAGLVRAAGDMSVGLAEVRARSRKA